MNRPNLANQPIRARYLVHVPGNQPLTDHYFRVGVSGKDDWLPAKLVLKNVDTQEETVFGNTERVLQGKLWITFILKPPSFS